MRTPRAVLLLLAALSAAGASTPHVLAQCDAAWDTAVGAPGVDSTVWGLLAANDASGVGPALYAGGQFTHAGGNSAINIAKWDGASWSALGTGTQSSGTVYALAARDGFLYAGGAFASMGGMPGTRGIARWDGSAWSSVGGGMTQSNSGIRAFAFLGQDLYAGGYLNDMGGVTVHKLARWDGSAWWALPGDPLGSTDSVSALAVFDDGSGAALYVGGTFADAAGDTYARNIFRWNGTTITPLGRGTNDVVESLLAWNGDLYAGGHFNRVYQGDGTEVVANKIARWDGTSWQALGTGMNSVASYHVWALAAFDDGAGENLYAGGNFTTAGGVTVHYFARWDGTAWHNVDSANLNGYVYGLAPSTYDGGLYIGGTFTTAGSPAGNRIVRWGRALPVSPVGAVAEPAEIIAGDPCILSVSGGAGDTVYWYTDGCSATLVGTGNPIVVNPLEDTTYYARAFDGTCWSYACNDVTVTVNCAPPTITQQPVGGVICAGHAHQLCVAAEGAGVLHYQWKRNGLSLIGGTSACYNATAAGTYLCIVTDDCAPRSSDSAVVTATSPALGDFNGDGHADLADFALLAGCMEGPGNGLASGCGCTDVNADSQIDLNDFVTFQEVFGG